VYQVVDVFTEVPFAGNMPAVFPDAVGLSDGAMQAVARELNLSENELRFRTEVYAEQSRGWQCPAKRGKPESHRVSLRRKLHGEYRFHKTPFRAAHSYTGAVRER